MILHSICQYLHNRHIRRTLNRCLALCLAALPILSAAQPVFASENAKITDTGFLLDTVVSITLYGTEDETILDDAFSLIAEYENMFSRTIEGSDVWNINSSAGEPVEVSEATASLIETALYYAELSDGAFDITIAPVVLLWNFQENTGVLPKDSDLADALTHVGYENIRLDGTAVTLTDPDACIDLGGIAKGYIADCVKDFLEGRGIDSGFINLGGNILTIDVKPDGSPWNIGIRKPFGAGTDLIATVKCENLSVVTSGTYERYFEADGTIYHHILDTTTGYPVENGLTSVTILSEKSVDGDALSTTCFVLGPEAGLELAESLDGIEAMFVTEDLDIFYTSGFPH